MEKNDWRNRGQEDYLMNVELRKKSFHANSPNSTDDPRKYNDHEHCDFCFKKIMENCGGMIDCDVDGYCTIDEKTWICNDCFNEFRNEFGWVILD